MKLKNRYGSLDLLIAVVKKEKVIRHSNGVVHVCAWPKTDPNRNPTANEQIVRQRFTEAVAYSVEVNSYKDVKQYYKELAKPWQTAHNVAVRDYLS